jgi:hypothetical protein
MPVKFEEARVYFAAMRLGPLVNFDWCGGARLLRAIATIESSFGQNCGPRVEPAYSPGGRYYKGAQQIWVTEYGPDAASSHGPWQIMFPTAKELGFRISPSELALPEVNGLVAVEFLNTRARNAVNLEEVARAYNGGNIHAKAVPQSYIDKLTHAYELDLKG